jgi:photosystem II stability/assembly factor-like uncharacterized protein
MIVTFMRGATVALLFSFTAILGFAQQPFWAATGVPAGGFGSSISAITVTPNGHLFAVAYSAGVFRSLDAGATWEIRVNGLTARDISAAMSMRNGDILVCSGTGVLRTTDEGDTWVPLWKSDTSTYCIAVDSNNAIFVGTSAGVYKTTDGGQRWSQTWTVPSIKTIKSLAAGTHHDMFAGTNKGVYRTTDGGTSWNSTGLTANSVNAILVDADGDVLAGTNGTVLIMRSTDDGATWTDAYTPGSSAVTYAFIVDSHGAFYASGSGGVQRSRDRGATWLPLDNGLPDRFISCLGAGNDGFVYAGTTSFGLFRGTSESGIDELRSAPHPLQMYPMPVHASAVASVLPRSDDRVATVVDALGSVRMRVPVPRNAESIVVPTDHLAPGSYAFSAVGERVIRFLVLPR